MEKVFPELVTEDGRGYNRLLKKPLHRLKSVAPLPAPLRGVEKWHRLQPIHALQAIRELKAENDTLHQQLKAQEERLRRLEASMLSREK